MKYDPQKIGLIHMAKSRSKTRAEKEEMLFETNGYCYVGLKYAGLNLCPKEGKKLSIDEVEAAHIIAHSKGGDECVAMCSHCNNQQGSFSLTEFDLALIMRAFEKHGKSEFSARLLTFAQDLFTEFQQS